MDVSLESKSLPSVGNSRKSYLQVTSQRLARGKLVHLHGRRSLALPSVGPGDSKQKANLAALKSAFSLRCSASNVSHISGNFRRNSTALCKKAAKSFRNKRNMLHGRFLFASSPCIPDLLMAKDFKALVLHVSELPIALPKIPHNSPQSRIALVIKRNINPNFNKTLRIFQPLTPRILPRTFENDFLIPKHLPYANSTYPPL
ncbi:hypothetical protein AAG906_006072 [Vitis piasezkii]